MSMIAIEIVEGWTDPIDFQLLKQTDAGGPFAPADLTGWTVTLLLSAVDGTAIDTTGDLSPITIASGTFRFTPDADDLKAKDSIVRARFKAVNGAKVAYFPNVGADLW